MIRKFPYPVIVSIVGFFVVLGIAWGSDTISRFYNLNNMEPHVLNFIYLWFYPLITLLLAAILLILAWFVLIQAPRNVWISLVFLVTGLFLVFYLALYFIPELGLPSIDVLLNTHTSYLSSSGGFIAIIGLLALVLRNGKQINSK
jgi:hypothetical protein